MEFLSVDDLASFATIEAKKAQEMIDDATALAVLAAPCLGEVTTPLSEPQKAAVRAILRGAILRWNEAGTGALQSETYGPFTETYDNRQTRRSLFWPTEIAALRDVCGSTRSTGAFSVDTALVGSLVTHADICALMFGALYCSCGAVLTQGYPLYEIT